MSLILGQGGPPVPSPRDVQPWSRNDVDDLFKVNSLYHWNLIFAKNHSVCLVGIIMLKKGKKRKYTKAREDIKGSMGFFAYIISPIDTSAAS